MNILLLRHGDALSKGYADADRPLSTLGEEQAMLASRTLTKFDAIPHLIVSSPFVRAVKTAELIDTDLRIGAFQTSEHLLPGADRRRIVDYLRPLARERILLVGHEPHLRMLLGFLIGTQETSGIGLKKGALASVEIPPTMEGGQGALRWLLTPDEMSGMR